MKILQSGSYQKDQSFYMRDITRKPKPINPMHQNENIYSPMFPYNSPKNPIGVTPYQPKSEQTSTLQLNFSLIFPSCRRRSLQVDAAKPQNHGLHPNDTHNQVGTRSEVLVRQQHQQQQHHLHLPIRTVVVRRQIAHQLRTAVKRHPIQFHAPSRR